jgi:hypothetical protein
MQALDALVEENHSVVATMATFASLFRTPVRWRKKMELDIKIMQAYSKLWAKKRLDRHNSMACFCVHSTKPWVGCLRTSADKISRQDYTNSLPRRSD